MSARPEWIKTSAPGLSGEEVVGEKLEKLDLNTVCREANCPNQGECWSAGTATFMLMGRVCTRNCRFCDVKTGSPEEQLDEAEPARLKRAVDQLELDYVVLTSVDRDDLTDGGARHFRKVIRGIKEGSNPPMVEGLVPDFSGAEESLELIARSGLDVLGHNVETVERLNPVVRDRRAGYELSLSVLKAAKEINPDLVTKSSIMVGLGETTEEVEETMEDLRRAGVDIVTVGQYLRPTSEQLSVEEYLDIADFESFKRIGENMGFSKVVAGPFVRSSYRAKETYLNARGEKSG